MHKLLLTILLLQISVNADFIDEYESGIYKTSKNKLYSFGSASIDEPNYKQKIKNSIHSDIASQIYSLVNTSTSATYTSHNDEYSESFSQTSSVQTDNIPLYSLRYEKEKLKDNHYYVLAVFDFKKALPIYLKKNRELVQSIDELYSDAFTQNKLYKKEQLLQKALTLYNQHQKHIRVISVISPTTQAKYPSVSLAEVEKELVSLMDADADNIRDVVAILIKRLDMTKFTKSIYVEPITLRDNHMYSEFSYEFKNYFVNQLEKYAKLSLDEKSFYKVKGYYHIGSDRVIINIFVQNSQKDIVASSMAQMKISEKERLLKKYKPLQKETPNSVIINEYLQSW